MIIKEFKGEYFTINWQVKTWKIVIKIPYFSYFKDRKIPTFSYFWLKIPTFSYFFDLSHHFPPCTSLVPIL